MTESLASNTERVRRAYDRIADRYDEYVSYMEQLLLEDGRRWICARAQGEVLEIGIGTGRNLAHYPRGVHLTGVDLNQAMLDVARHRAADLHRDVDLHVGDAQRLDFPGGRFDTVVATLALSSIPDDRRAVAEAKRVLRPGGRFLILDFARSPLWPVRVIQRLLEPLLLWRYGDHLLRDPLEQLATEQFVLERSRRSKCGIVVRAAALKPN